MRYTVEIRETEDSPWVDISGDVAQFEIRQTGRGYRTVVLDLIRNFEVRPAIEVGNTGQVCTDDTILVHGVNVSDHVSRYVWDIHVGDPKELHIWYVVGGRTIRIDGPGNR